MIVSQRTSQMPADQFTAVLAQVCGQYNFEIGSGCAALWGDVERVPLAGWEVAMVASNLERAAKTPRLIGREHSDSMFVILQQHGISVLSQNDRARPSKFSFSKQRSMQLSLHVPRDGVQQRYGHDFVGGLALRGSSLTVRAIASVLGQACGATVTETRKRALQKEALLGFLGLLLFAGQQGDMVAERSGLALLFTLAEEIIVGEFRAPELTGQEIARRTGISLRKL